MKLNRTPPHPLPSSAGVHQPSARSIPNGFFFVCLPRVLKGLLGRCRCAAGAASPRMACRNSPPEGNRSGPRTLPASPPPGTVWPVSVVIVERQRPLSPTPSRRTLQFLGTRQMATSLSILSTVFSIVNCLFVCRGRFLPAAGMLSGGSKLDTTQWLAPTRWFSSRGGFDFGRATLPDPLFLIGDERRNHGANSSFVSGTGRRIAATRPFPSGISTSWLTETLLAACSVDWCTAESTNENSVAGGCSLTCWAGIPAYHNVSRN